MSNDWNAKIIDEFRANEGRVGGGFEGAPLVLVHHVGRKSGSAYIAPMMYLADNDDPAVIYVFASKGGAPDHPAWYRNLVAAGSARIEIDTNAYDVTVTEVSGDRRDRIYAEQGRRFPSFADYEVKTAGIRTIPVLALTRTES